MNTTQATHDAATAVAADAATDFSQVKLSVSLRAVRLAAMFRAENDVRWYFNAIRIESAPIGGVYIVGCDGYAMLAYHDPSGSLTGLPESCESLLINKSAALDVAVAKSDGKRAPVRNTPLRLIANGLRVSIAADHGMEHSAGEVFVLAGRPYITEEKPLDWQRVIPKVSDLKPGSADHINPVHVERAMKAARVASRLIRGYRDPIRFWSVAPGAAAIVQFCGDANAIAVIMPVSGCGYDGPTVIRRLKRITEN